MNMAIKLIKVAFWLYFYECKISNKIVLQSETKLYLIWVVWVFSWTYTLPLRCKDKKCCSDTAVFICLGLSQALDIKKLT